MNVKMLKPIVTTTVLLALFAPSAEALEPDPGGVFVRVIDVGAGHAAVIQMPEGFHMVYDAGNFTDKGKSALAGVQSVITEDEEIDLMVLSHSDADHLGAVDKILDSYTVRTIIRSGYFRDTGTWRRADAAIDEAEESGAEVIDLDRADLSPGTAYRFGDTLVTVVSGFSRPPESWGHLGESEKRNAGSIVLRLLFGGRSVLFTGDAVGREEGADDDAPIATEKFMIENAPAVPIDSDVLVAPHHGSDDASSSAFIRAVSPEWVIFPAGHKHGHPMDVVAKRYLAAGVDESRMFRTDRHDNEGGEEWASSCMEGYEDPTGDDDVDIVISASGVLKVAYRHADPRPVPECETS